MRFAKIVFILAGIWGIAVLTPLFFLVDVTGRQYLPPTDYPQFFYGFLSVALAFQLVFLAIGSNPVRYRLFMLPSILEKVGYVVILAVLHSQGRISWLDAQAGIPDGILGALFIAAYFKTPSSAWLFVPVPSDRPLSSVLR